MGVFKKINFGLTKTRDNMSGSIDNVLNAFEEIGDELYDELIEVLVMGDVGVYTAEQIIEQVKEKVGKNGAQNTQQVREYIKEIVADMLSGDEEIDFVTQPAVILVIGVNGVGKTTTIGKMAAYFKAQGKKVILGAADTFRAAAIDQLEIWAERAGVDIVKHKEGADPAAVIFDTINAGIARDADIIICDTAGRLHNKKNLMEELAKIYKVIDRELPYSDREIFLVLDATTGQNAVNQAKEFKAVADITGIILTKLDGTARGGVVLSIKNDLKVPVKFIGVGEGIDDLQPFNAQAFAEGLFDVVSEDFVEEELEIQDNSIDTQEPEEIQKNQELSQDEEQQETKEKKKKKGFFDWFKTDKDDETKEIEQGEDE
ncbi:MAG: signal recognition particle-docking protein FtsY [Acutalibacteraceae bacterium]|jgi:fused signal recognition particle receptor|nr:signal recognition particle-docking protein FtsY [Clostridiales bacterium]